ncbi:hypothetical protein O3M35_000118 [Rhynocoris fuscipes]|uniref:Protein arginine methyltransferase NDUFAF7 n=1 Tax=Rhynocoris fuscipes TaxID=488301 RepID=A0AAW1DS79_9HEMI
MCGPISIADYMREVLTNPKSGYYMKNDVFGQQGDFITSPEISQLFGEILAVWTISEWQKLGKPIPCQLVEFGPGRGTMLKDILRVYKRLGIFEEEEGLSVHLVEVSRAMSNIQAEMICDENSVKLLDETNPSNLGCYQTALCKQTSAPVFWYSDLQFVPKLFSIVLAHEFFDALPIHKFQKVGNEWKEVLIDIAEGSETELRFVLSRSPTPASVLLTKNESKHDHLEISPQTGVIMEELARRLEENGGFALVIDYGHNGDKTDTFRAFKRHSLHDPLVDPGTADLTADVDFSYLRKVTADKLISLGPITQRTFLSNMHIDTRLKMLLAKCPNMETQNNLLSGYHMLTDQDKMGDRFKMMAFFPLVLTEFIKKFPVAGFEDIKY